MFLHGFLISIYFVHPVCIRLLYILQHDLHCPQNKSVLILVLCILLFFKIKYNVIIGLIMTGIIILLCSAITYSQCCKMSHSNCYVLLGFIILEDLLTVIFCILTKRFKQVVFIVMISLSAAFVIIGGLLFYFGNSDEVKISLAGGFWNTALDLAALCFASSLKFISYQLTPLYYVEQFPLFVDTSAPIYSQYANLRLTAAQTCLRKYIIFSCLMVLVTIITTSCGATIPHLERLYKFFYVPLVFSVLGAIPVSLLFIIVKLKESFPLNEVLISLSVLLWSFAIPAISKSMKYLIFAPWSIAITLAVVTLIIGYKTVKRSTKVSIILLSIAGGITMLGLILLIALRIKFELLAVILSGIFLAFAVLIVLYLTGQGIKRCYNATTKNLLPVWLALITWVATVYLFISIAVMFIEGRMLRLTYMNNNYILI
uniref:Uncharacterized protein n=1 Tax=Trichobilharzia regenti TaxID=157069 RepID=A0AA85IXE0_TRIRE|nr:unnamed protein product [Trichobilharzia regenti]